MSTATKAAEIIADAATPAVETAMKVGEALASTLDKPVEVVFEIVERTPPNKKVLLAAAGAVLLATTVGAGWYVWNKKKAKKVVIEGDVVVTDEEIDNLFKNEEKNETSGQNGSKKK